MHFNTHIMYPSSPNPASGGSSSSVEPRFPTTVVLNKKNRYRRGGMVGSSDGTGPTYIDASPISLEDCYVDGCTTRPGTAMHVRRVYDVSRRSSERDTIKRTNGAGPSLTNKNAIASQRGYGRDHSSSRGDEALTWRMDPSTSLSDFTLIVVGIDDKVAIEKYTNAKKARQNKKTSRRRDKWMVEGLYLDMSESDTGSDVDQRNDADNRDDRGCVEENDRDLRALRSSTSGAKSSICTVVEKYHLHRVNLAVGPKRCDYFVRLLQKKGGSGDNNGHSIEVPLSCLPAIPTMLDYLYEADPATPVYATTATAIPLRYLGALLGNRSLFDSATHFLQTDLRPETAVEYLRLAEIYGQKKLAEVCIRMCAENFGELKITWLAPLTPTLMRRVLHSKYFAHPGGHVVCSKIASYLRCQMHKIDRATLLSLTSAKFIPVVSSEEALFFIQMMIRLGIDMEESGHDHHISTEERSLYERCIDAAPAVVAGVVGVQCGRSKACRKTKAACGDYSRLPSSIKVDLLEYALAKQVGPAPLHADTK